MRFSNDIFPPQTIYETAVVGCYFFRSASSYMYQALAATIFMHKSSTFFFSITGQQTVKKSSSLSSDIEWFVH